MIKEATLKLIAGNNLELEEAKEVFEEIFSAKTTPVQLAAFLTSLKIKGESFSEILAAAQVIRSKAEKINVKGAFLGIKDQDDIIVDTCGTGGSGINKFNVSSAVAFVVSASGIKVAKHGNRAMSSSCGSADVLEALGIKVDAPVKVMEEAIKQVGIGFLFAPLYHPALKEVALVRKELGFRTIFNILGPLCNPAQATHQLLGVHTLDLALVLAKVLKELGLKEALVVYSRDLKDEVSLGSTTLGYYLNNKRITKLTLNPSDFGLKKVNFKELEVKDAKESALVIESVFAGKPSAFRNTVLANASACFYLLGKASDFKQGVKLAARLIDEGKVKNKFLEFKNFVSHA